MRNPVKLSVVAMLACALLSGSLNAAGINSLAGYEWRPGQTDLTQDELLAIARDESQPNFIRARATAELERYPNEQTWDFLVSQVTTSEGITRRRAVDNLCAIFVAEREDAVMDLLASPLADADPHLRIRAATCLKRMESARAAGMLKNWRAAAEPWEVEAALP